MMSRSRRRHDSCGRNLRMVGWEEDFVPRIYSFSRKGERLCRKEYHLLGWMFCTISYSAVFLTVLAEVVMVK